MTTSGPGFLRWRSWGEGPRRALLLHGSGSSGATWWQVGPALAQTGWRVKAPDLPSHGASPRVNGRLTPERVADWVVAELAARPFDLVVGHAFGAAVALALVARHAVDVVVLEEPTGPHSVSWTAEATALVGDVEAARRDPDAVYARCRTVHPHWAEQDCRYAVRDLARCVAGDVADGLRLGPDWPGLPAESDRPTLVLAAPDAPGVNELADASVLRGADRQTVRELADTFTQIDGGHCLHRDRPNEWLQAVLAFTG